MVKPCMLFTVYLFLVHLPSGSLLQWGTGQGSLCLAALHVLLWLMVVQSGRTVMHWAAAGGHGDILKLLVNNYAIDPDVRDEVICDSVK